MSQGHATVFIVDDEATCAEAFRRILNGAGYATRWFGSAEAFLAEVEERGRGCLLLDVMMPGMDGFQLQEELNRRGMEVPVVFLTGFGTVSRGVDAMKNGACDFLEKPVSRERLLAAVERALEVGEERARNSRERGELQRRYAKLSGREKEVMDPVVRGLTNREVGELLHISEKTVKVHRARVMAKMLVDNLPELVLAANILGRV